MNGPELFDAGERIMREAARETAPEWVIARSLLAIAHFNAARAAAAINENHAQALLPLDAAVAWQRSQDPATSTPAQATAPEHDGRGGAERSASKPWVMLPRDLAVSLLGPVGWSLRGWTVAANNHLTVNGDTSTYELVITDDDGNHYMTEYERPNDRDKTQCWAGDTEVMFEAAEPTTRTVTDYRRVLPGDLGSAPQDGGTDG